LVTGTLQSLKTTSAMGEVRSPIFSSLLPIFNPGVLRSIMNAVIPIGPNAGFTVA